MVKKSAKDVNGGRLSRRPPDYLGKQAKVIWRKVVVFLEDQEAVNTIDSGLVELYTTQYELYRNAYKHIRENGEVQAIYKPVQDFEGKIVEKTFQGYRRNPMTQIYTDAIKSLTKIGSELGLSPKSRAELMELTIDDENVDLSDFMKGGKEEF